MQPRLIDGLWHAFYPWGEGAHGIYDTEEEMREDYDRHIARHSPFGQAGDRLYVRECWAPLGDYKGTDPGGDALFRGAFYRTDYPFGIDHNDGTPLRWKPSIHMPRWAARLVLDVLSVEVQRLHDITEDGAKAEGCKRFGEHLATKDRAKLAYPEGVDAMTVRGSFAATWNRIYGRKHGLSWKDNPMVRVVSFDVADESRKLVETYRVRAA